MIQQKVRKRKRPVSIIIFSTISENYGTKLDVLIKKRSYLKV